MKQITLIFLMLFSFCTVQAQTISGTIMNEWMDTLEGANIAVKGTDRGAVSINGRFQIEASKGDILVISYVGYITKEVMITTQKQIDIQLEMDTLDEVLITGYTVHTKCYSTMCCFTTGCVIDEETLVHREFDVPKIEKAILYPNPSSNGIFNLKMIDDFSISEVIVVNMSGQVVQSNIAQKMDNSIVVDISSFTSGIYLFQLISDKKIVETKKGIKL